MSPFNYVSCDATDVSLCFGLVLIEISNSSHS